MTSPVFILSAATTSSTRRPARRSAASSVLTRSLAGREARCAAGTAVAATSRASRSGMVRMAPEVTRFLRLRSRTPRGEEDLVERLLDRRHFAGVIFHHRVEQLALHQ